MPGPFDFAFMAFVIVGMSLYEQYLFWPRFRAAMARGEPDARRRAYRIGIAIEWTLAGIVAATWIRERRSWSDLRLTPPATAGWIASAIVLLAIIGFIVWQFRSVARARADTLQRARARLTGAVSENPNLGFLLPSTTQEHRWFLMLSLTAGVCEELIYRGYFTWVLAPWLGAIGAVALVSVAFGFGHAYQGRTGILKTAIVGAAMGAVMLATGWLIPAMIAHALLDVASGTVGFVVLQERAA